MLRMCVIVFIIIIGCDSLYCQEYSRAHNFINVNSKVYKELTSSKIFDSKIVKNFIKSGEYPVVRTYSDFSNYKGKEDFLYFDDEKRGGFFKYQTQCRDPIDSGIVFKAKAGGYWKRIINQNSYDVRWFGAIGENTDDTDSFLRAVSSAGYHNKYLYIPIGNYHISKSIIIDNNLLGLIGEDKFRVVLIPTKDITTIIIRQPGIYQNFTVGKYQPITQNRIFARGISFQGEKSVPSKKTAVLLSTVANIVVIGLNGFGIKYENMYDSYNTSITVEQCGNEKEYAFQVLCSNGETTNMSTWDRLQIENCYRKAIYISPLVLGCTFSNIHAERQINNSGDTVFYFGGNRSNYSNIRLHTINDNAIICVDGFSVNFDTISIESVCKIDVNAFNNGFLTFRNFWMPKTKLVSRRDQTGFINLYSGEIYDIEKSSKIFTNQTKIVK